MDFYSAPLRREIEIVNKSWAAKILSSSGTQIWVLAAIAVLVMCAPMAQAQSTAPNAIGTWHTVSTLMPINPIHTALMSNGKILVVSGSGNYPPQTTYQVGVWDPSNNTWTPGPNQSWDMFCNGMIVLPDSRPFIMGGTIQYDPFFGAKRTSIYDPSTGKYTDMEDMAHGRWYPTGTVLGDGRVMIFSGLDENGGTNTQVEIYKVGVGWGASSSAPWTPPLYPRMHLLPNGKVFYSGSTTQSRTFDPSTNTWSLSAVTNSSVMRTYGSSVLFPLTPANAYKPKVMIFGGGSSCSCNLSGAELTTEIIDLSASSPKWVWGPNMSQQRIEMNATLLPNGKILTVGGSVNDEDTSTASLKADLYDTASNSMGSAGSNAFPRLYHSVSLLLPDATVWVAGGNPARGSYEQHVEIYTPPYLYNSSGSLATRPSITSVTPGVIGYGTSFQVQTPDAANISSVVIMKNGAVTHAFDMDQRLVGLSFTAGSGVLNVTGPPNGNIAPPGYYMIFLFNTSGVPSVAKFVQVLNASTDTPPKGTITSPASDIVIAPGQSVTFAGTGTASSGSITGYSWSFRGATPATSSLQNPGAVTFSTAGTYTASFTVTDSAGNTDPSPPVRTITVATKPAPVLSAVSPNVGAQGKSNLSVTLTGSNFLSSPTCSFGSGITVNSCSFNSSSQITANINILSSAVTGSRNVTVTNTDGQNSTLTNGFTVQAGSSNPAPTITSVSPNTGVQGQSGIAVTITGTNFLTNPSCNFDAEQGLTVTACTYNSATKIAATLSISSTAVVGKHNVVVTDTDGQVATAINVFTVNSPSGGVGFSSGFGTGSMMLNGNAAINPPNLSLTTISPTFQAASAWFPTAVNIQNFTTDFSFQTTAGAGTADGLTFTLQNGPTPTAALGGAGGNLGYGLNTTNSVAVKFDLYNNNGEGSDSTGLYLNGASPTTPAVDMSRSGVDLHSGHKFSVHIVYDGTNLTMTITDTTNPTLTFTQSWPVNIPSAVGGSTGPSNTAFAGFTGATGGFTANQNILSWTMSSGTGTGGGTVATPTFSPTAGTYLGTQTVALSDSTSGATIFYTLDGSQPGTSAGSSTQQYSGPLTVSSTETIRALATASGMTTSATQSATYTIESQVATPTFSPGQGSYPSAQAVSISTTTSGATIYYTTNGTTPTTSSSVYSGPITVSATETLKAIATESGFFNSNVATAAYTIGSSGGGGGVSFANGFTTNSMVVNGNAALTPPTLSLTTTSPTFQASSAWFPTVVNIQNFTTDFNFQTPAGTGTADGLTFTLQNDPRGTTAIGGAGGNLGYGLNTTNSVAVKFDLYNNNGEGSDSTGLYLNGASPTTPAVDMTGSGIDLHSGDIFHVHMTYDGTNLVMTITDASTNGTFMHTWTPVDIPKAVGGSNGPSNTALAGFTGATGGFTANQNILSWTMTSGTGSGGTVATPTFNPAAGTYPGTQTVTLSDTTSGATIFYTLDGSQPGTSAGGSTQQYSGPLTVSSTETIKALATASGMTTSATQSATYTIESQVATPTFSPAAGSYPSAQPVSISTSTSGANIYYTTDGSTPTTASTPYSGPITVSASETLKAIAAATGFVNSNVAIAAYTIGSSGGGGVSLGSGFTTNSMVVNGNAALTAPTLSLTTTSPQFQAASAWFPTALNVQKFTTDFTFQLSAGSSTADGFTFAIQNNLTTTIGGSGGGLGYLNIPNSVAVKFDLYSNAGEGTDSTGLFTNGQDPTMPAVDMTSSGVDLHSGHKFSVHIVYDGTNLTMTITDTTNPSLTFTNTWMQVNIPGTVGANTAFVGFTGGTGGFTANQSVLGWTYTVN
ncbi:MAG TPA: chitobiase/beta-hexosaminidase C-terminal domain-containing protein [Candidatus Acidoferrales bacterium]|nr:chitobiase/beta-hexosaminidase C-terminal domain-containing protein [Candidatus Acidoferrales bacterium]